MENDQKHPQVHDRSATVSKTTWTQGLPVLLSDSFLELVQMPGTLGDHAALAVIDVFCARF